MVMQKTSMGRQKITMTKISKKSRLQVTFSKRRAGLFKKASELCTLCGVDIAIIVFSPADKAFFFGHPDVESIIDRFLTQNPPPYSKAHQLVEAHRNANVHELNMELTQCLNQLEMEKKYGETLYQIMKAGQNKYWWQAPINELGLHELEQLRVAMEELKKNVEQEAKKNLVESTKFSPFMVANGLGDVSSYESKQNEISAASTMPHVYNFGYGHGPF